MYSLRLSLGQITIEMHHALQSLAALCITPVCLKQHPVPDQMLKYQCKHLRLEVGTTLVTALLTFSLMSLSRGSLAMTKTVPSSCLHHHPKEQKKGDLYPNFWALSCCHHII